IGWEALHVCIDDATRLAYSEILPDEKKESAIGFLGRALAWLGSQGISVERVMTDNGSASRSQTVPAGGGAARGRRPGAPAPTPRAPTARRNGSSKPLGASGPTPSPMPVRRNAVLH